MNFFIPKSLYRSMDGGELVRLMRELGRQGRACERMLDMMDRHPLFRSAEHVRRLVA